MSATATTGTTATGMLTMMRFIVRRNWLRMLIWLVVLAGMIPLVIDSSIAGRPSLVAGIFTSRFLRSTSSWRRLATFSVL